MLKILVLGDIMGKIGRGAIKAKLPLLRKKYKADLVIVNGENLAHGTGMTSKTLREVLNAGVDFCTSGNHIFNKYEQVKEIFKDKELGEKVIRPANYRKALKKPGKGYKILTVGNKKIAIINLMGKVFMKSATEELLSPLKTFDTIYKELSSKKLSAILVDIHAEATSEKSAMGWYADGRATLVWGTHTHIPTADIRILPKGTGYITDLGMVGERDSVIGENKENSINSQKKDKKITHNIAETGIAIMQGIYVEIESGKTTKIKQISEEVVVA